MMSGTGQASGTLPTSSSLTQQPAARAKGMSTFRVSHPRNKENAFMPRWSQLCGVTLALVFAVQYRAFADDAYVFRFVANGARVGCAGMQWADDVLLYNGNSSPATIRFLSATQGFRRTCRRR